MKSALEDAGALLLEALRLKAYSPATIAHREGSMRVLFGFLRELGIEDPREVTRDHLRRYATWLIARQYSDRTRESHLSAVRVLFKHLEKLDAIFINPAMDLPIPCNSKRLPRVVLSREQALKILNAPDLQTMRGVRDKAILEMFYSTGLRLNELIGLKVADVDCDNGYVRVRKGKGGVERVVALGKKAGGYVREYLERVRGEWSKHHAALWLSVHPPHPPIKSAVVGKLVRSYGREVGVSVTPHIWRHTCATHLISAGAHIVAVQRQLGHRSLRTTQIYTRVSVTDLVAMHRKTHPLNRQRS